MIVGDKPIFKIREIDISELPISYCFYTTALTLKIERY